MERVLAVDLDFVDGPEFERVCKEILERLGYGRVEDVGGTGDEGRDLLVHTPRGLLVVECKHHPVSSIGRPVVQKLHSAIIMARGVGGMLITTGRFSGAAVEYARRLQRDGVTIDMIDRPILTDMARRAGLDLHLDGTRPGILTYTISEEGRLAQIVGEHLDRFVKGNPHSPSALASLGARRVDLVAAYVIRYNVDATFETSVGVVHREHISGGHLFLNGINGAPLLPELRDFFAPLHPIDFDASRVSGARAPKQMFGLDQVSLRKVAKNHVSTLHTRIVTYEGRNNQRYSKVCTPGERDIVLIDVRQVYLPVTNIELHLLRSTYQARVLENPAGLFKPLDQTLSLCRVCSQQIGDRRLLCNTCGAIAHQTRLWKSHSFVCRACGQTLCRRCAVYVPSLLLFRRPFCRGCAAGPRYRNKRVRPFPALGL